MRLLITGSRDWDDASAISRALFQFWVENQDQWPITLVHGGAKGADLMAAEIWAKQGPGFHTEEHKADWETYGKSAGYVRNAEMVNAGADYCLAFIKDGSRGATMCATLASNAKIPTRIVAQNTPVESDKL